MNFFAIPASGTSYEMLILICQDTTPQNTADIQLDTMVLTYGQNWTKKTEKGPV